MSLTLAAVRELLEAARPTARYNPPVVDGIAWRPFCSRPECSCFLPDALPCSEYCDGDDGEGVRRCGCCGWPEKRHVAYRRVEIGPAS